MAESVAAADDLAGLAAEVVALLGHTGRTVATAESLTGGLLTGALTAVPGASRVLRGGVVAYASDLKHELLGVDASLLDRVGAVHPDVAMAMASGARRRLGAHYGLATTGVAGPAPQDAQPPGTVWVAVADASGSWAVDASVAGDRDAVRRHACCAALAELRAAVAGAPGGQD